MFSVGEEGDSNIHGAVGPLMLGKDHALSERRET